MHAFASPYLLPDAEPMPYSLDEHIVSSSSKLIVVDKLLKDILPKGERVLIFSVRLHFIVAYTASESRANGSWASSCAAMDEVRSYVSGQ